jgi:hypothetical protein
MSVDPVERNVSVSTLVSESPQAAKQRTQSGFPGGSG